MALTEENASRAAVWSPEDEDRRIRLSALAAFAGLCVLCDFFMAPIFVALFQGPPGWNAGWGFVVLGCILAQGNVLAAWLALDSAAFLPRLTRHWGIAGTLYLIWLAGLTFADPRAEDYYFVYVNLALVVPLVSLAAQLPLWTVRHLFGWRLVREAYQSSSAEKPLAIRDLMLATLLVAATVALARGMPMFARNPQTWFSLGAGMLVAGSISTVAILPAGALLMRQRPLTRGLAYSGIYAALLCGLPWVIVEILRSRPTRATPPFLLVYGVSCLMVGFAVTLMMTGVVARLYGFRLVWGRRGAVQEEAGRRPTLR